MLTVKLNATDGIAILEPHGELSEADFKSASAIINPYIEKTGKLNGILIHVKNFPRWDSFAAFLTHFKFIRDHHRKVSHIAFVTDSSVATFAEHIASHFVSADIKCFAYQEMTEAIKWISEGN
jgi:hypothetical protein